MEQERRSFVWIDDDAIDRSVESWASNCGLRSLIIRPSPRIGLSPQEFDVIDDFVADAC